MDLGLTVDPEPAAGVGPLPGNAFHPPLAGAGFICQLLVRG